VPPGSSSAILILRTNATQFVQVNNSVINGSVAVVPSLGPVIPEPSSLAAAALAGFSLLARRRAK
jgi:hypothetical protein